MRISIITLKYMARSRKTSPAIGTPMISAPSLPKKPPAMPKAAISTASAAIPLARRSSA